VIPPVLPIWLLAGLPPDLPGAPHGWPPTADDSVRRAIPLDPAAAAAAAATTPDEAGRSGSSRTCHLRSNHRAHGSVRQADPGLDHPTAAPSRPGRPLDLAGAGRLHPAAPGPPGRRRPTPAVGAAPPARSAVALPGPQGVSAPAVHGGVASRCAETLRALPWPPQRPPIRPRPAPPRGQEAQQEAQAKAAHQQGRLSGPTCLHVRRPPPRGAPPQATGLKRKLRVCGCSEGSGHPRGLGVADAGPAVGVARKEWPPSPLGALTAD
jgi:hypothetical protein